MKFLIVVLAVASLCLAEPEADPALLYAAYSPYYAPWAYWVRPAVHNAYGYAYPGSSVAVSRLDKREAEADPQVLLAAAAAYPYAYTYPYVYSTAAGAVVPQSRLYTPYDCVTAEGCAVQTLKDHALAKRDADADPSLLFAPAYYGSYYYNPYYYVPRVAPVVATVNKPVTYTHLGAHPIHPTTVVEQEAHLVGHTFVKREAEADPSLLYAPAYYGSYYYNPYYYVPRVAPVVATVNKPVTYTHLGAHPIHPTTVVEQEAQLVGHALV